MKCYDGISVRLWILSLTLRNTNKPYVQFESVGDFIPEPRCSKFVVGLQTRGSKMGGARGPVGLQTEGPRETGAPTCAKYLSVCSVGIVQIVGCSNRS